MNEKRTDGHDKSLERFESR